MPTARSSAEQMIERGLKTVFADQIQELLQLARDLKDRTPLVAMPTAIRHFNQQTKMLANDCRHHVYRQARECELGWCVGCQGIFPFQQFSWAYVTHSQTDGNRTIINLILTSGWDFPAVRFLCASCYARAAADQGHFFYPAHKVPNMLFEYFTYSAPAGDERPVPSDVPVVQIGRRVPPEYIERFNLPVLISLDLSLRQEFDVPIVRLLLAEMDEARHEFYTV